MRFDLSKELARVEESWRQTQFSEFNPRVSKEQYFTIYGPDGCGKTSVVQDFVRSRDFAFYFSFEHLSSEEALSVFLRMYLPGEAGIEDWKAAAAAFVKMRGGRPTLLVFEDESSPGMIACSSSLFNYTLTTKSIKVCQIQEELTRFDSDYNVELRPRTIVDFLKAFPQYSREDCLRLFALTGGILTVAKELDEDASFAENVHRLLRFDSAFSTCLPNRLQASFRTPESYIPILKSLANGRSRLGEIAKDVGWSANKCLNYLEALIKHDFVNAEKLEGCSGASYTLSSSYYIAWCRFVCGKRALQVGRPDELYQWLMEEIDTAVTLPALQEACLQFIRRANKDHLADLRWGSKTLETKKSVEVKLDRGKRVTLDRYVKTDDAAFCFIFPHTLDAHYTKEEIRDLWAAVDRYDSRYNTHLTVFSPTRFSDWCVHEAARNKWFHPVTMERLRF